MQLASFGKIHTNWRGQLPVMIGAGNYHYYAQSAIKIPARAAGDMTRIHAKCEVTSPLPYTVMLGCFLSYGRVRDPTKAPPALTAIRTQDLVKDAEHYRIDELTIVTDDDFAALGLPLDQPQWTAAFILYAAADAAQEGAFLKLESADYSEMSYEHFAAAA